MSRDRGTDSELDNREIIADGVSETEEFIKDVLPDRNCCGEDDLLDVFMDTEDLLSGS